MKLINKIVQLISIVFAVAIVAIGCQKMERPELGDFPKDTNPPGGPLKFYASFDGASVDSIRANFGVDNNVTFVDGINGKAVNIPANGYVVFPSANDFKESTNFTVAFWLKKNGPNPAGGGTAFAFGLATQKNIWTRQDMFLLFEDAGQSNNNLAAAKFYLNDQWFEFVGDKRIPNLLNNQWHHMAFVFDQASSTLTTYVDGAAVTGLPANFGKFNNNGGKVDLTKAAGLVVGGPGHYAVGKTPDSWMGNWNGQIDQFRMYNTALSAADVAALFNSKK